MSRTCLNGRYMRVHLSNRLDMLKEAIPEDMPVIEEQALRDQVHIFPTDANLRLQTHPDGDNEWLVPSLVRPP